MKLIKFPHLFIVTLFLIFSCEKPLLIVAQEDPNNNKEDATKILFIGNSLTFYNNMPNIVERFADEANKKAFIDQATIGGAPLDQLIENSFVTSKIYSQKWDYIILQSNDITAFPNIYNIEINTLETIKDKIYSNNEKTQIIYQMIWGSKNGVTFQELNGEFTYYSFFDYIEKLYNGTLYIANNCGLKISPVGWAWRKIRLENPEIELFDTDNRHPSYRGSYLTAAVHYSIIFGESSTDIQFPGNLTADEARIMREAASSVALDSLYQWGVR